MATEESKFRTLMTFDKPVSMFTSIHKWEFLMQTMNYEMSLTTYILA